MRFKPYKIHKYTTFYKDKYKIEPGSYAELCVLCGWPLGEHSGLDHCPGGKVFVHKPIFKPQFFKDEINKHTRTI